jgi:hypothetical protein
MPRCALRSINKKCSIIIRSPDSYREYLRISFEKAGLLSYVFINAVIRVPVSASFFHSSSQQELKIEMLFIYSVQLTIGNH